MKRIKKTEDGSARKPVSHVSPDTVRKHEQYEDRVQQHDLDQIFHEDFAMMGWEYPPDRDETGFGAADRAQKSPELVHAEYEFRTQRTKK